SYETLLELASGGMASVFAARHVGPAGVERVVVVKRVHRHLLRERQFCDMFRDEARLSSAIRHANVVPVLDVIEAEGELCLVLEYVESVSLGTILGDLRRGGERLDPAIAARVISDLLAGLHAAHEATDARGQALGIVHRDVSPHNVIVGSDGTSR